ncbi:MAG TPA: Ig-like domain-containing protein, partial [Bryobacteraceae bacterium]|nr:Ig-like domain-containing protein [Bryobacteraceae bacterium]
SFNGGVYLVWNVSGHVQFKITRTGGNNAVISGLFFDSPQSRESITASAGTPQSTAVNTAFSAALQATVKDGSNNPVSGVTVTFTAPGSGASATFNGSATVSVVTNSSGVAAAPVPVANTLAGSYTVTATVAGVPTAASFNLTNLAAAAASVTATAGTPQGTAVNTPFVAALQATVKDGFNNPVSGVTVTFTAPGSGATATFNGSATVSVVTDSSGMAISPVPVANGVAGSYTVSAAVAGLTAAAFALTNNTTATPPSATFVGMDTATQGNWKSVYGADGYNVIGDAATNPAYVSPVASGQSSYVWAASTSDPRALQKATNPTDRIAGTWFSLTQFTIDMNISDTAVHQVALYFLDWDSTTRRETINVLDGNGTVLNTQALTSSFNGGVYLVWNVSGHVQFKITRTGGNNAVISGLFFEP